MGKQNLKHLLARMNKVFRLSVIEDSTHKQISSYRFTRVSLAALCIGAFLAIILLLYCAITLTPLRTTIPGYPDAHFRKQAISNAIRIDSLESAVTRWKMYSENLVRVLEGEETLDLDSLMKVGTTKYLSDKSEKELARRDSILKATVREEEQFGIRNGSRPMPLEGIHFFTPLKGVVSRGFEAAQHPWVDITAPVNSVVSSVLDGTVVFSGWDDMYGYTMIIQHNNNILSVYRHNARLLKASGEKVGAGTPVALVGSTGSLAAGEHLHLELWHRGEAVDPAQYISF